MSRYSSKIFLCEFCCGVVLVGEWKAVSSPVFVLWRVAAVAGCSVVTCY